MIRTVYADMLFLVNFIINYLVLFTSSRLCGSRVRRLRLALGAFVGGVYGVSVFWQPLSFLTSFFAKLAAAVFMCACAFGFRDMRRLLRMTLIFYGISFAFGGAVLAAYLLGADGIIEVRNSVYYIQIPLGTLLLSSGAVFLLLSIVFRRSGSGFKRKTMRVKVCGDSTHAEFFALLDTGATLTDPLTDAPIVISEYEAVRNALPQEARLVLDAVPPHAFPLVLDELPSSMKFRLIPYKTMNSPFSVLLAFRPEAVTFDGRHVDGVLLAFAPDRISDGGGYSALTGGITL